MDKEQKLSTTQLWILCLMSGLSTAGAAMSNIALSTLMLQHDSSGISSSLIETTYFFGVATVGFISGYCFNRWTPLRLGILCPLLSCLALALLLIIPSPSPNIILSVSFIISALSGIDQPNHLTLVNKQLEHRNKASFFSKFQVMGNILAILAPLGASYSIKYLDLNFCFYLDIATYLVSVIPWVIYRPILKSQVHSSSKKESPFIGYKQIVQNKNLSKMTLSRILTNFSYVGFFVGLPIFAANIAQGNQGDYAVILGNVQSIIRISIVIFGLAGAILLKKFPSIIPELILLSVLLGVLGVSGSFYSKTPSLLYVAAVVLGLGQYAFKMVGITLGQAITPENILAQVITAGDTTVRLASFGISLMVPKLILISYAGTIPIFLCISSMCLASPFLLAGSCNIYIKKITRNEITI